MAMANNDLVYQSPLELLNSEKLTYISAPMVRYSKLPFRQLVRLYGIDIAYTPMIMADSFVKSEKARLVEFEFDKELEDRPLIVQFGSNSPSYFGQASKLVHGFCDGVDINSGCPQRWALNEGIGAALIDKPGLLCDMIQEARRLVDDPKFTISVKIRIHPDIRKTVSLARQLEAAGADWLTVHGRLVSQRGSEVNQQAIADIRDSLPPSMPVVANGDVSSRRAAEQMAAHTKVQGVMTAQALLNNPAVFAGYETTPAECVSKYMSLAVKYGTQFTIFQHHLMTMLEGRVARYERNEMHCICSTTGLMNHVNENVLNRRARLL